VSEQGCLRVPLARYPGMNPFVLDWLASSERAIQFLPRGDRGPDADTTIRPRRRGLDPAFIEALVESNRRWGSFVEDELQSWNEGRTATLVAGQQVGFAGGPLYTLAKIASLVRMKRDFQSRGMRATIFFWLATEDHDYDEAAMLQLPASSIPLDRDGVNRQLDLVTLKATRSVASKQIVGPAVLPEPLIAQLLALYEMPRPSWLREGISFRDSFAELLATAVGEKIVFVDALLPELRRAGAKLFEQMLAKSDAMQEALAARSQALELSGYKPQIVPREGHRYTLLFRLDESGERHIIDNAADLDDPATISTSANTRPLLQDAILRPDVFIGGPSEVAYYAQIAPLHELLGIPLPRVALRGHALVAPKRVVRLFPRFDISPEDVFAAPDRILAARHPAGVDEVKSIAEEAQRELAERITRIGEIALPAEHALARAISRSIGHIEYHFGKLTERAIRGLVRKDRERYAAARELVSTFYPDGHVEDRVVGWFAYWHRFGQHLVDTLVAEIEPDADVFKILGL
jgi:bacillithiol synthase